jgi:hypothetical protein
MSQSFRPAWGVLEPKLVTLVGNWAIGSTGAVGTKTGAKGMSLTRTGTGAYTIQLTGANGASVRATNILNCHVALFVNDTDPTNDTDGHWTKMLAISDSAGTVTFQCVDEAGVVREAPSGAVIAVTLHARLSSAS